MKVLTNEQLAQLYKEAERIGKNFIKWERTEEGANGRAYNVYKDTRNGEFFEVVVVRSVHIGFNTNNPDKVAELVAIVEREGVCDAYWGVTGRTMHSILAERLAKELPQFNCEIGYNYLCRFTKKES